MSKKRREDMTAAEKRANSAEVRRFLKDQTGSPEGSSGAGEKFIEALKRAVKPKK